MPRTPIKESERRRGAFEDRYGEGATELDALEALQQEALAEIVRAAIGRYYDAELGARVAKAEKELRAVLAKREQAVADAHRWELDALEHEYAEIERDFAERVVGYAERHRAVWQAISEELDAERPDLDNYPMPEPLEGDELPDALYDSGRDYLEQLEVYKRHQGKAAHLAHLCQDERRS